jgi:hypothetical protein
MLGSLLPLDAGEAPTLGPLPPPDAGKAATLGPTAPSQPSKTGRSGMPIAPLHLGDVWSDVVVWVHDGVVAGADAMPLVVSLDAQELDETDVAEVAPLLDGALREASSSTTGGGGGDKIGDGDGVEAESNTKCVVNSDNVGETAVRDGLSMADSVGLEPPFRVSGCTSDLQLDVSETGRPKALLTRSNHDIEDFGGPIFDIAIVTA